MNRRRVWIGLAVVAVVALFVPAKIAASWRPVAVAPIESRLFGSPPLIETSSRFLIIYDSNRPVLRFDLTNAEMWPALANAAITVSGTALWEVKSGAVNNIVHPQLRVRRDEKKFVNYDFPDEAFKEMPGSNGTRPQARADDEKVELLVGRWYCRWDARSGVLERARRCDVGNLRLAYALARDGETIIVVRRHEKLGNELTHVSTRTGQIERRPSLVGLSRNLEQTWLSSFGNYALYRVRYNNSSLQWPVVNTSTGQIAWTLQFDDSRYAFAVFSPDETMIAHIKDNRWQILNLKTGALIRTLPVAPNAQSGAFSPDGATLYSIADGVLYRQRAR